MTRIRTPKRMLIVATGDDYTVLFDREDGSYLLRFGTYEEAGLPTLQAAVERRNALALAEAAPVIDTLIGYSTTTHMYGVEVRVDGGTWQELDIAAPTYSAADAAAEQFCFEYRQAWRRDAHAAYLASRLAPVALPLARAA